MKHMKMMLTLMVLGALLCATSAQAEEVSAEHAERALRDVLEQLEHAKDAALELLESAEEIASDKEVQREIEEHLTHAREWMEEQLEHLSREPRPEPEPLGKTVRLTFAIEGVSDPVSVSVATTEYTLNLERNEHSSSAMGPQGEESHEEYALHVAGTLRLEGEAVLVTCGGSVRVTSHAESGQEAKPELFQNENIPVTHEHTQKEAGMEFDASILAQPGQTYAVVTGGGHSLTMSVTYE